jgi:hypothetical protein
MEFYAGCFKAVNNAEGYPGQSAFRARLFYPELARRGSRTVQPAIQPYRLVEIGSASLELRCQCTQLAMRHRDQWRTLAATAQFAAIPQAGIRN